MKSDYDDRKEVSAADRESALNESERVVPGEAVEDDEPEGAAAGVGASVGGSVDSREYDALQERYLRLAAEYENFRRRTERERSELRDRSQGQLVEKVLNVLDDLDRLTQNTPDAATVDSVLEGVRLIERNLLRALETAGLELVPATGEKFNPEYHEALMMTPTSDPAEDEMVGNVFQTGYRFKGNLLRPARVQVKKADA